MDTHRTEDEGGQLNAYDTSGTSPPHAPASLPHGTNCFEAACRYQRHGLVPISLVAGEKKPIHGGWNTETRPSFGTMMKDWTQGAGVGLVTGRPGGGRIIVVDVDVKGDTPGDPTPFLDTTPCVARTPSGGYHFFYRDDRAPEEPAIRNLVGVLPGVDLRADGGQVAAWPTQTAVGMYEWETEAALDALLAGELPGFSTVRHLLEPPGGATTSAPQHEPWVSEVLGRPVPIGQQRDHILRVAGYFVSKRVARDIVVNVLWPWVSTFENRPGEPWTREQVLDIVADLERKDASARARRATQGPSMQREGLPAARTFADICAEADEVTDWLWTGYLARESATLLHAKPKVGKSELAFGMIAGSQQGEEFLGQPIKPLRVVYLSEEPPRSIRQKVDRLGIDASRIVGLSRRDVAGRQFDFATVLEKAKATAKETNADLIVIDTLAFWARLPADAENDAGEMTKVGAQLTDLASESTCAVLAILHSKKGNDAGQDAIRGSSALAGAADFLVQLRQPKAGCPERELLAQGRDDEIAKPVRVTFGDGRYRLVGNLVQQGKAWTKATIANVLPVKADGVEGRDAARIAKETKASPRYVRTMLAELVKDGVVVTEQVKHGRQRVSMYWRPTDSMVFYGPEDGAAA